MTTDRNGYSSMDNQHETCKDVTQITDQNKYNVRGFCRGQLVDQTLVFIRDSKVCTRIMYSTLQHIKPFSFMHPATDLKSCVQVEVVVLGSRR